MEYVRRAHAFTCHPKPWCGHPLRTSSSLRPVSLLIGCIAMQILRSCRWWYLGWINFTLYPVLFYLCVWLVPPLLYFLSIAEFKPTVNKYKYLTCFCFVLNSSFVLYVLTLSGSAWKSMSINTQREKWFWLYIDILLTDDHSPGYLYLVSPQCSV